MNQQIIYQKWEFFPNTVLKQFIKKMKHVLEPIPLLIHTTMTGSFFSFYYRILCQEYYEGDNGSVNESLVSAMDEQLPCHKRTKMRNNIARVL